MSPDHEELRRFLSDIQITFFELSSDGENLVIGLIDYLGNESQVRAEGIYQLSISRIPRENPSYTILSCIIAELVDAQIEKRIPGYAMIYVRWPDPIQHGIYLKLEGDVVVELTCRTLARR